MVKIMAQKTQQQINDENGINNQVYRGIQYRVKCNDCNYVENLVNKPDFQYHSCRQCNSPNFSFI